MSARGFWPEAAIALLISTGGVIAHALLLPLLGVVDAGRLLLLGVASVYALTWLLRHQRAAGCWVFAAGWMVMSMALLTLNPPLLCWLLLPAGAIWLQRCLLLHSGPLAAMLDGLLCVIATVAAFATLQSTRSLWLALWVFFLLQALHVFLAGLLSTGAGRSHEDATASCHPAQRFERARHAAEAALSRLSKRDGGATR